VSGVGCGTRNIRIGRIASSTVSTHPIIVGSRPVQSGVRISGNVCADRRKLRKALTILRALHLKPGLVVGIIGPRKVDLAR
jgi:hypothetical protein